MTYARSEIVDEDEVGIYHCTSRCVRRAFLCGWDKLLGRSFDYRKDWVKGRLKALVDIFAIEVIAYAVMSNHLHSLLRTRPDLVNEWSEEEVAKRWRLLFPYRRKASGEPEDPSKDEIEALVGQPQVISEYRRRLSSISWFNRCLNENIAKRANREDDVTGRFWEGRFSCQRVFDTAGILACAAYVDLNPVRAKVAKTPEASEFTSIEQRIKQHFYPKHPNLGSIPLVAIEEITEGSFTLEEYLNLVDETGRLIANGKRGALSKELLPILERLKVKPEDWVDSALNLRRKFKRIIGPVDKLKKQAEKCGKQWFQGMAAAKVVFCNSL